jgi:hypothetical protein
MEERLRTLAGSRLIPLGDDQQRRILDSLRVVVWLARVPVNPDVLEHARWLRSTGGSCFDPSGSLANTAVRSIVPQVFKDAGK